MYEMEGPHSAMQPSVPIARLAGHPAAVRCPPRHQRPSPPGNSGYPAFPALRGCPQSPPGSPPKARVLPPDRPGFPPDRPRREVVSAFLLPREGPAQGLEETNLKILWPSTRHPVLSPA